MQLIPAIKEHLPLVRDIALLTWPVAYKEILSGDQLAYMLELFYSIPALEQQMDSGHRFTLCFINNKAVGFSSISPKENEKEVLRLNKLYVLPGLQGKGAGKKLLDDVKEFALKNNFSAVELNVNRNNTAKTFYDREGFVITSEVDLPIGNNYYMNDYIMTWSVNS